MKHIINATVENQPGVLARIVGLFSGRGYNIESLNVGPTQDPAVSRMTMSVDGDEHVIEQVTKQLNKLVDVIKVNDLTAGRRVERELVIVAVAVPRAKRSEITEIATLFKAEVVDIAENSLTLQYVGDRDSVESLIKMLRPHGILVLSRSGPVAVQRAD